jgi:predicted nucleic acid binding AN1-type Zn finger protein
LQCLGHITAICATNNIDNLTVVVEGKRKVGGVNSKSADNKRNQSQWQVGFKRNKGSVSGKTGPLASKVRNCTENGCSASSIHMSDCNMNNHAASDLRNADFYEDENPTSPLVLKSLRGDMKQEQGGTITALDQGLVISNTTN